MGKSINQVYAGLVKRCKEMGFVMWKFVSKFFTKLKSYKRFWKGLRISAEYISYVLGCLLLWLYLVPFIQEMAMAGKTNKHKERNTVEEEIITSYISDMVKSVTRLNARYAYYQPATPYMVINSKINRFYLYKRGKMIREGICSTGSNILLENGERQTWVFKTPKGVFHIQGKLTSPVWRKPDWAFVEEGLPVPSQTHQTRYEFGVLGDYALSLGHGYLIHGTLYQRFLGLPVTHGCVRLGDDDLKAVYYTLRVGSKVFIY